MRVAFSDYSGKGTRLGAALVAAGHELVDADGQVAVVDHDHPTTGGPLVEAHERSIVYPHGGTPILSWDGAPPHPNIRLHLVHGPGHAEVFALYGHPVPAVSIGFTYCDLSPFRYPEAPRRVLFAPSHPMDNGFMDPRMKVANAAAFEALISSGMEVTVRSWARRSDWGLAKRANVRWTVGGTLATDDIDQADLVVADGTVAALAVARGCPTLFLGSGIDADESHDGSGRSHPHFARYAERMRYPYDINDGPLPELVERVCQPDDAVGRWRAQFVGGAFDADLAVALVEAVAET